jgi:hypothetical protein
LFEIGANKSFVVGVTIRFFAIEIAYLSSSEIIGLGLNLSLR